VGTVFCGQLVIDGFTLGTGVRTAMRASNYNVFDASPISRRVPLCDHSAVANERKDAISSEKNGVYSPLEIRTDTLYRLIAQGVLVVDDFRELDQQAQKCIRQLIMENFLGKKT
jgi:hypothetical protein